jgi:hypothetical protein
MKNLFFSLAFSLIGTVAFASSAVTNSVIKTASPSGTCIYEIIHTITLPSGRTFSHSSWHTVEASSAEDCANKQAFHVAVLNQTIAP